MDTTFPTYKDAIDWLEAHIDFERHMPTKREFPTLDRMESLVTLLGSPHQTYPAIHVTGTNGKGSVTHMLRAILCAHGLRVGTYTSPNLAKINERMAIDGIAIDDDALAEQLAAVKAASEVMTQVPTRFEILTAAGLHWMSDEAVDVAIIEVGLGGTWDATNVVQGNVGILTNISADHLEVIGPTLFDIAKDKAGIAKPGCTFVLGETTEQLAKVVRDVAMAANANLFLQKGTDFSITRNELAVGGRLVTIRSPRAIYESMFISLHGAHQATNLACAIVGAESFIDDALDSEILEIVLANLEIPGRLEVISHTPLVVVDAAHNPSGAKALGDAIQNEFPGDLEKRCLIGMLEGRDPFEIIQPLINAGVNNFVCCEPLSPRAMSAEKIRDAAERGGANAEIVKNIGTACESALESIGEESMLIVTGSFYVIGDARSLLVHLLG